MVSRVAPSHTSANFDGSPVADLSMTVEWPSSSTSISADRTYSRTSSFCGCVPSPRQYMMKSMIVVLPVRLCPAMIDNGRKPPPVALRNLAP
jgi:hypothetical protein